jgi:hypothetical protein
LLASCLSTLKDDLAGDADELNEYNADAEDDDIRGPS